MPKTMFGDEVEAVATAANTTVFGDPVEGSAASTQPTQGRFTVVEDGDDTSPGAGRYSSPVDSGSGNDTYVQERSGTGRGRLVAPANAVVAGVNRLIAGAGERVQGALDAGSRVIPGAVDRWVAERTMGNVPLSQAIREVGRSFGQDANETAQMAAPYDPNTVSGKIGGIAGAIAPTFVATAVNPLLGAVDAGVQFVGQADQQYGDTPGNTAYKYGGGAINALLALFGGALGQFVGTRAGGAVLVRAFPELTEAAARGGPAAVAEMSSQIIAKVASGDPAAIARVGAVLGTKATVNAGAGAFEGVGTQAAINLLGQNTVDDKIKLTDGMLEQAVLGGALPFAHDVYRYGGAAVNALANRRGAVPPPSSPPPSAPEPSPIAPFPPTGPDPVVPFTGQRPEPTPRGGGPLPMGVGAVVERGLPVDVTPPPPTQPPTPAADIFQSIKSRARADVRENPPEEYPAPVDIRGRLAKLQAEQNMLPQETPWTVSDLAATLGQGAEPNAQGQSPTPPTPPIPIRDYIEARQRRNAGEDLALEVAEGRMSATRARQYAENRGFEPEFRQAWKDVRDLVYPPEPPEAPTQTEPSPTKSVDSGTGLVDVVPQATGRSVAEFLPEAPNGQEERQPQGRQEVLNASGGGGGQPSPQPGSESQTRSIRNAAFRDRTNGAVYEGANHGMAMNTATEAGAVRNNLEPGFTTSDGKFVDDYEAMQIARAANQTNRDADHKTRLASEYVKGLAGQPDPRPGALPPSQATPPVSAQAEPEAGVFNKNSDSFVVEWGTRSNGNKSTDFDTYEEAIAFAKKKGKKSDHVTIYDADGNETSNFDLPEPPAPQAPAPAPAKEPWQMTRDESRIKMMQDRARIDIPSVSDAAKQAIEGYSDPNTRPLVERGWREQFQRSDAQHQQQVAQAVAEGKDVPPAVLADYPDLIGVKAQVDTAAAMKQAAEAINPRTEVQPKSIPSPSEPTPTDKFEKLRAAFRELDAEQMPPDSNPESWDRAKSEARMARAKRILLDEAPAPLWTSEGTNQVARVAEEMRKAGYRSFDDVTAGRKQAAEVVAEETGRTSDAPMPQPQGRTSEPTGEMPAPPASSAPLVARLRGDETGVGPSITQVRHQAREWAKANIAGKAVVNEETGRKIVIAKSGIDKAISGGTTDVEAKAIAAIPQILEKGVYGGSESDRKGRAGVKAFHYFDADVQVASERVPIRAVVREDNNGNLYYDHYDTRPKEKDPAGPGVLDPMGSSARPTAESSPTTIEPKPKAVKQEITDQEVGNESEAVSAKPETVPGGPSEGGAGGKGPADDLRGYSDDQLRKLEDKAVRAYADGTAKESAWEVVKAITNEKRRREAVQIAKEIPPDQPLTKLQAAALEYGGDDPVVSEYMNKRSEIEDAGNRAEAIKRRQSMTEVSVNVGGMSLWAAKGQEKQVEAAAREAEKIKPEKLPDYWRKVNKKGPQPWRPTGPAKSDEQRIALLKDFEGTPGSKSGGALIANGGKTVYASDGASGMSMTRESGTWGEPGRHLVVGGAAKSKLEKFDTDTKHAPVEQVFSDIFDRVAPGNPVSVTDTVRNLRKAEIFLPADQVGVLVVQNPDGTLGFASRDPAMGMAVVNIQDGHVEMGAVNPTRLANLLEAAYRSTGGDAGKDGGSVRVARGMYGKIDVWRVSAEGQGIKFEGVLSGVKTELSDYPYSAGELRAKAEDPMSDAAGFRSESVPEQSTGADGIVTDRAESPPPPSDAKSAQQWEEWAKKQLDRKEGASDAGGNGAQAPQVRQVGELRDRPEQAGPGLQARRAGESGDEGYQRDAGKQLAQIDSAIRHYAGSNRLEETADGYRVTFPNGKSAEIRVVDQSVLDGFSKTPESIVANEPKLYIYTPTGERVDMPKTPDQFKALPEEIQQQFYNAVRVTGYYGDGVIHLSRDFADAKTVHEEMAHAAHDITLTPAEKRMAEARFGDMEQAAKRFTGDIQPTGAQERALVKRIQRIVPKETPPPPPPEIRGPSVRRIIDDRTIALQSVIGAAKMVTGRNSLVKWTEAMKESGVEFANANHRAEVWKQARRLARMSDEERAQAFIGMTATPADKTSAKSRIRFETGQVDRSKYVRESTALRAKLRAAQRASEDGWAAAITESSGIRNEFARLVKETLPPGEREGMLMRLKSMNTIGQLNTAIKGLDRAFGEWDLKDAIADYKRTVASFDPDKLKPELRDKAKAILDAFRLGKGGDAEIARAKSMLDYIDRNPDHMVPQNLVDAASRALSSKDIRTMAPDDIRQATDGLKAIIHQSQLWNQLRVNGKVREAAKLVSDAVDTLDRHPDLKPGMLDQKDSQGNAVANVDRGVFGKAHIDRSNAESMTYAMDRGDEKGVFGQVIYDALRRGRNAALEDRQASEDRVNQVLKDSGLKGWGYDALRDFSAERVESTDADGKLINMTRAQRIDLAGNLSDPETRAKILTNGFKLDGATARPPFTVTEKWARDFTNSLDPRERDIIRAIKQEYNGTLKDRQNEVFVRQLGYEALRNPDYYPSRADRSEKQTGPVEGSASMMRKYLEAMGMYQERQSHGQPMMVRDAFEVYHDHMNRATNFIHNAENLHSAWTLLGTPEVRNGIVRKFGQTQYRALESFVQAAALNDLPGETEFWSTMVARMGGRAAKFSLALPTTAAKQLTDIVSMGSDLGVGRVLSALPKAARDIARGGGEAWAALMQNGLLRARYMGDPVNMVSPKYEKKGSAYGRIGFMAALRDNPANMFKPSFWSEHGLDLMQAADAVNAIVAYHATDPSLPVDERAYRASQTIARVQNTSDPIDYSPGMLQSKTSVAARLFNQFGSQAVSKYNMLSRIMTDLKYSAGTPKDYTRFASRSLLVLLAGGVLGALIGEGFRQVMRSSTDDDKTGARLSSGIAGDTVSLFFGPLAGSAVNSLVYSATTGRPEVKVGDILALEGVKSTAEGAMRLQQLIEKTAEDDPQAAKKWYKAIESLWTGAGLLTGQPWMNLAKMAGGVVADRTVLAPEPVDPRLQAKRDEETQHREMRAALSGTARRLLAERSKLEQIPGRELTSDERARLRDLAGVERAYQRYMRFGSKKGADAERWRVDVEREAERVR